MSESYNFNVMFKGFLNENDDDEEEVDFGEFDTNAFFLQKDLELIEPNRDPKLETEYLGNNGEFELLFTHKTTWLDRDADIEDYLEKVQEEIENSLNVIIEETEKLGYTKR